MRHPQEPTVFADRVDAGRRLAERLRPMRDRDVVVLGLPRGGVPVAAEVAHVLDAPLDVLMVRKLGLPPYPEVAMGAIGEQGLRILDRPLIDRLGITDEEIAAVEEREQAVLRERGARFRAGRRPVALTGCTAVIIDDGIATGATARVACLSARQQGAATVIVATPVAAPGSLARFREADDVIALTTPAGFRAVGQFYRDFSQTTDEEVIAVLDSARAHRPHETGTGTQDGREGRTVVAQDVQIPAGRVLLEGVVHLPRADAPVVVFAHGSNSGRHSPRNRYVAEVLQEAGFGTLLMDLLTPEEAGDRSNTSGISLLADRLTATIDWLHHQPHCASSAIGLFGASTGAGAALWAAAEPGSPVGAVVSRGGRPDLAAPRLDAVTAPVLLIVGDRDLRVLELNRQARTRLRCENRLETVPGATHLFEEPGALDVAARLARDWFVEHLAPGRGATGTDAIHRPGS